MCMRSGELQTPGIIDSVLYLRNAYNYIRYNIPIESHKTRSQSCVPFLKYALDDLGSGPRGGLQDRQNRPFFGSEFSHMGYLHIC